MIGLSPLDLEILNALLLRAMRPKTIADTLPKKYRLTDSKDLVPRIKGRIDYMIDYGLVSKESRRQWIRITREGRGMLQVLN